MNEHHPTITDPADNDDAGGSAISRRRADDGMALPLVIIMTAVVALTVVSLATFSLTSLKSGRVSEERVARLTAADAGLRYAIDQLKLRNAGCILDTQTAVLPGVTTDFNSTGAEVTCVQHTSGYENLNIQAFATALTGEGVPPAIGLMKTSGGSDTPIKKIFGGPVYLERIDAGAVGELGKKIKIEDGPLLYHDTSPSVPCTSVSASSITTQIVFEPALVYGPVCVSRGWKDLFKSPEVPDLTSLPDRSGSVPLPAPLGSYTDVGSCRVFEPGRYISPPDVQNRDSYFKSGDYLFDFPLADPVFEVKSSTVTMGVVNPQTATVNDEPNPNCDAAQTDDKNDPLKVGEFGATIYMAGKSQINIQTHGHIEIHARVQDATFVSIQALCVPNGGWCRPSGGGGFATAKQSTATAAAGDFIMYTDSGNNKELVTHALLYAPLGQFQFGNTTNTATQKMLGGMVLARLDLHASASASNFEIAVPISPITAKITLTSTATKGSDTSIQAVVEYRPYEPDIVDRVRVNSWRVCESTYCTTP
ncbi:MAG: hypothetical protein HKN44_12045 [Ilumatobacter sp.]|nr:hypothetical protein [Ilumatobacter sp.]